MNNTIKHVLCSTDEKYSPYCEIMLISVLENNRNVNIYIITSPEFSNKARLKLKRLEKKYNCNIIFITVDPKLLVLCKTDCNEYISVATYYKIFAAQLLPSELKKVLYLDCDIIINKSLDNLWNIDISNYALAGVDDIFSEDDDTYQRLNYPKTYSYVNAGMLLINLEYWRKNNVLQNCLNYIEKNYNKILWCEQDVLNALYHKSILKIPLYFNYQIPMLMTYHFNRYSNTFKEKIMLEKQPIVIHYVGNIKPWMVEYYLNPYYKEWNKYKNLSKWRFFFPVFTKNQKIKSMIKRYILWPLGWKKNNPYINLIG